MQKGGCRGKGAGGESAGERVQWEGCKAEWAVRREKGAVERKAHYMPILTFSEGWLFSGILLQTVEHAVLGLTAQVV